jgi:opacity protein-like surface antigen
MTLKKLLPLCLLAPLIAHAQIHPVIGVGAGADRANLNLSQNITIFAPFQNAYLSGLTNDTEQFGGVFVGLESEFYPAWMWQTDLSFYQTSSLNASGDVLQFTDPAFDNFRFNFQIQSRRYLVESKLMHIVREHYYPYLTLGLGEAVNKAYGYKETPFSSADVPMGEPFGNHTLHSFTYQVGLGIDMDVYPHVRLGLGYRFVNLGRAALSPSPLQDGPEILSFNNLYTNELLAQLTYSV